MELQKCVELVKNMKRRQTTTSLKLDFARKESELKSAPNKSIEYRDIQTDKAQDLGVDLREDIAKMPIFKRSSSAPQHLCIPNEEEIKKAFEETSNSSSSISGDLESLSGSKRVVNHDQSFNQTFLAKNKSVPTGNHNPVV